LRCANLFPQTMKRAFIFFGGWEGHEPKATSELFAGLLTDAGYDITLVDKQDRLKDADEAKSFDLIVPMWTMGEIDRDAWKGLDAAVKSGTGCAGWHGGMGDAFRNNVEYQWMVGGQFVGHPGGIIDYSIDITQPDHPIVEGLEGFSMHSEQYYMHVDPGVNVLATTTFDGLHMSWVKGVVMPVAWTKQWGEGKVAFASVGHVLSDFDVPEAREMVRRGLIWATR